MKTFRPVFLFLVALLSAISPGLRAAQAINGLVLTGNSTFSGNLTQSGTETFLNGAQISFAAGSTLSISGTLNAAPSGGSFDFTHLSVTGLAQSGGGTWGSITGTLSDQTDLASALSGKAAASHTHSASQISDASANGRSILTAADYAAMRSLLGLVVGTNVQAYDADLDAWSLKTAPSGTVVGTSDTQTLTNKSIDAGQLTGTISASRLPTSGVTLGTYGSATAVPQIVLDASGRATSAGNVTITPALGSITGLGTSVGTALAANVGSAGAVVVNGGALGTPASGNLTNGTALPIDAGTLGTLPLSRGGTGLTSYTAGDILYADASGNLVKLPKSTSSTRYLSNRGASNIPQWDQVDAGSGISGNMQAGNFNNGVGASGSTFLNGLMQWATPSGSGNVTGPSSSTATAIARYTGTTGTIIQDSAVTIADTTGAMSWASSQNATLTAGSSGAVLTLGQGNNGNVTVAPKGTGVLVYSHPGDPANWSFGLGGGDWGGTGVPYFRPTKTNAPGILDVLANGTGVASWVDIGTDFTTDHTNGEFIEVRYAGDQGTPYGQIRVKGLGTGSGRALALQPEQSTNQNVLIGGTTNISGTGGLKVFGTTDATANTAATGAFQVLGGASISKRLNVLGGSASTSATTGTLIVSGGVGVTGNQYTSGSHYISSGNITIGPDTSATVSGEGIKISSSGNATRSTFQADSYNNSTASSGSFFLSRRARGSYGSEAAVQADDTLFSFSTRGYATTGGFGTGSPTRIEMFAAENFSDDTHRGGYITFSTAALATGSHSERVRITSEGNLLVGTTSATGLTGAGNLKLSGAIAPGGTTVTWTAGSGSPESVVTAGVGSLYTRTNGGAGTTLYIKESGTGNTGWVAK